MRHQKLVRCADPVWKNDTYSEVGVQREQLLPLGLSDGVSAISAEAEAEGDDLTPTAYKLMRCNIEYAVLRNPNKPPRNASELDWDSLLGSVHRLPGDRFSDTNGSAKAKCYSWVYDQSVLTSTIATQMNFVCERKILSSHALMLLMLGQMFGSLLGGSAADFLGRKKLLMISLLVHVVCSILTTWVNSIFTVGLAYLVNGFAMASCYCSAVLLGIEQVGPMYRHMVVLCLAGTWSIGILWVGLLAYFLRDWSRLQLAASVPEVLFIFYMVLVSESPRWLTEKRRFSEAEKILERIARRNGKALTEQNVLGSDTNEKPTQNQSLLMFLQCPPLLLRLAVVLFNWFACSLTYYGLSLGVGNLSGDIHLNFCLSAFVELASYVTVVIILERVGRKTVYCSSILLGGAACLLTFVPVLIGGGWSNWAMRALAMTGKFGVNISFATAWIMTPEMFPTSLRAGATGACSSSARIGGVAASYLANLTVEGRVGHLLPQIIFGSLGLVAGLTALTLPETNQAKLPDSLEEAVQMKREKEEPTNRNHQESLLA
ncbi:solute carrier family 22 member 1 [Elysia marginata]|uniref:Solute carrier family 22 member 1 n=1 Tax=Elysia marginata TaxID=1093978 RepID=A0AAV4INU7_9GAST|nr:solute carrier family 22 member 1 [Elysia marginata]